MKISKVEPIPVALPRRRDHTWSGSITHIGTYLIVKLHTEEGLVGLGEAPALIEWGGDYGRYFGETPQTCTHIIEDYLLPAIRGMNPYDIGAIHARMDAVVKGHMFAKAAIDIACYDLMGKAADLPANRFLGGQFRDAIPLAHSFGSNLSPAEAASEAETVLAEGITALKIKVGRDPDRDLETMSLLREAAGPDVRVHVDANKAWTDPKTAAEQINRLNEFDVDFAEQPCEGIDELAEVRKLTSVRIMADESAWTSRDIYDLARREAVDMISIYTTKPGGMYRALQVASICEAVGFPANVNGSVETGVGNAANLHLAAACRAIDQPSVLMTNAPAGKHPTQAASRFYEDDIITEAYGYEDGHLLVPDGAGLGIEVDEEKLAKYRVS